MSIAPTCDMRLAPDCEGEVQHPGALLFGPPRWIGSNPDALTPKYHVCVPCYGHILALVPDA